MTIIDDPDLLQSLNGLTSVVDPDELGNGLVKVDPFELVRAVRLLAYRLESAKETIGKLERRVSQLEAQKARASGLLVP